MVHIFGKSISVTHNYLYDSLISVLIPLFNSTGKEKEASKQLFKNIKLLFLHMRYTRLRLHFEYNTLNCEGQTKGYDSTINTEIYDSFC